MKEQNKQEKHTNIKNVGEILKECRNSKHISVNAVSEYLAQNDFTVAPKTIYGWENGHSEPNAKILMLLCNLYEIDDILKTFGFPFSNEEVLHLTRQEERLIKKYRENPDLQPIVDKLLDIDEL